ncbi:MAG: DNA repair protein RecO [Desulfobacteraceae bacterium]|nr:DNA repair protein RecO [Desulfobacteraceae bacterium]
MAACGQTPAVVIGVADHGESDKIVTCYCPGLGKLKGIAKGAKRSRKRFVNKLELFSLLEIQYATGSRTSLVRIDQAEMLTPFPTLRRSYDAYAGAALICELLLNWTRENDGDDELFALVVWALTQLDQGQPVGDTLVLFQIRMLDLLGYRPRLHGCLECGGLAPAGAPYRFSPSRSGLLCSRCGCRQTGAVPDQASLSLSTVMLLLKAQDLPREKLSRLRFSPAAARESLTMLRHYGTYLLQREIYSWNHLGCLAAG